uniref:Uncharacterized protein AlNc14C13G1559 n=1 Tax=Albugo laibachii Nc14 TaxID=890382 RepID=F0W3J7_9STRA|nr:conserved hypothetical protein [Albugo laibachii Nc14]CCA16298.1 conserved hypothetical protein [Albugo laibachii Nc14]|eukprot:CCA16298.1 conserved hypothetical protein [Albugo laibachii Nc14]
MSKVECYPDAVTNLEQCHDFPKALNSIQKAILFTPECADLYRRQAEIYAQMRDYASAIASYRKFFSVSKSQPQEGLSQFAILLDLLGVELLQQNQQPIFSTFEYQQLENSLIEAVLGDRSISSTFSNSIISVLAAVKYFTESIDLRSVEKTFLHRGIAYFVLGEYPKALQDVDYCTQLNKDNAKYHNLREKICEASQHVPFSVALTASAKTLKKSRLHNNQDSLQLETKRLEVQAATCILMNQNEEAVEKLSRAIELISTDSNLFQQRAIAFQKLGSKVEALKDTEYALKLLKGAKNNDLSINEDLRIDTIKEVENLRIQLVDDLVEDLLKCKNYQLALDTLNKSVTRDRRNAFKRSEENLQRPKFYIHRGDAYRGLGNLQPALADYRKANEITPNSQEIKSRTAFIHYSFGIELFNKAQFDEAELEFDRATKMDPHVGTYHLRKGDAARFMQKHLEAFENYREALRLNPTDKECFDKIQPYLMASNGTISAKKTHNSESKTQQKSYSQGMQQTIAATKSSGHLVLRHNRTKGIKPASLDVVKKPA